MTPDRREPPPLADNPPAAGARREGRPALVGAALVATAALLWACLGLVTPVLLERGMSAQGIAFWRAAVGGALFAVHATVRGVWPRERSSLRWLVGFGVVGVGIFYWSLQAAIETGGVSLAWLLLYTAPAWVALGAPAVLGERVGRRTAGLVVLTLVGIVLVALGGGRGVAVSPSSVAWGLVAGLTYATWYFVSQRAGTGPVATAAVAMPVGALVLAPAAAVPDAVTWLIVAGSAVATTYLPALAYYSGIARLPAARASVIATIEPVIALVFAWAVFGERLALVAAVGAVVVLAAALAAALAGSRGSVAADPAPSTTPRPTRRP